MDPSGRHGGDVRWGKSVEPMRRDDYCPRCRGLSTGDHPDGIDDLDAWLADWPVWPDCVDLAEEVARVNRAVEQYRLSSRLDIDAPVLVLAGTAGPDFLGESARAVHEVLPHSRLVEFDGVSHSGPSEVPGLISAEVDAFLRGHR